MLVLMSKPCRWMGQCLQVWLYVVVVGVWLLIPASSVWADEPDVGGTPVALDQKEALRVSQSVIGTIPSDYTFQDREGRPVRLSQYRGKPLLVSFIYTGCFQVCPLTTRSLQKQWNQGVIFLEPTNSTLSALALISRRTPSNPSSRSHANTGSMSPIGNF